MNWQTLRNGLMDEVVPHIKEAIPSSWTPDRLIRSISRELRHERASVLSPILFVTLGLVIGGAAAMLLAPKTGHDLRADLTDRLHKMRQRNGSEKEMGV